MSDAAKLTLVVPITITMISGRFKSYPFNTLRDCAHTPVRGDVPPPPSCGS